MRTLEEKRKARSLPLANALLAKCIKLTDKLADLRGEFEETQKMIEYYTLLRKAYTESELTELESKLLISHNSCFAEYDLKDFEYEIKKEQI